MKLIKTKIKGLFLFEPKVAEDERGFFLKAFDKKTFEENGLFANINQLNISRSKTKGTIRGLHYQETPFTENKFFRCIKGSVFYVVIDMRKYSPTFLKWEGFVLSDENKQMVYVPEMCATGYQALQDGSEVLYGSTCEYSPIHEKGVKYNDPVINIEWPLKKVYASEKDKSWEEVKR